MSTENKKVTRILTGLKPTSDLHIGNYLGAIRPCIELSQKAEYEVILMCADWHGLTDRNRIHESGNFTQQMMATFLAFGYNIKDHILILQSDFPQIQELSWYLGCATAVGMLERSHAYKDAVANGKKPTAGLFNYPLLMAADILCFDGALVPVGADQAQHLEYCADISKLFNNAVGAEVLIYPKPLIQEMELVVGIDGEKKMSKSYDNTIPLFGTKKEIEKRIKSITTDSKGLDDVKDPESCAIFKILKGFGSPEAINHMRDSLTRGKGYGYGHAKMDLIAEHEKVFGSRREAYEHYLQNPMEMAKLMETGYEKARKYAAQVRTRVRTALGLKSFEKT